MTGRWVSSTRKARLPRNWAQLVAATRARAGGRCEAAEHVSDCTGIGTDCDHISRGDDHRMTNLQWLSRPCHDAKTHREALEAIRARTALARHPRERHPGLR